MISKSKGAAKAKGKSKGAAVNGPALLPGVSYIRMSSDEQEASPDQQRAEVAKLAERYGYRIVREYFDSGISGAATSKRKQFLAMMNDAEKLGDFRAILCWDQDRFGRFDSIEAGRWVHPLRERGIQLVTVAQGAIDWSDFAGRMIYSIQQEGKAQYLVDLSRNVIRGLGQKAREGLAIGKAPLGFDRVYFDAAGTLVHRVPHGQKFRKPKDWIVRLTPSGDARAVELVRWLFERFATTDCSIRGLVCELNARGERTSEDKYWRCDTVTDILRNPVYCGVYVFGRQRAGKFYQFGDSGEAIKAIPRRGKRRSQTPAFRIDGHHAEIVSPEVFQAVQAKMDSRTIDNRKPRTNGYPLARIVHCGHCGGPMTGHATGTARKWPQRYYVCAKGLNGVCTSRRLNALWIEEILADMIQEIAADEAFGAQLLAELKRQAKARKQTSPARSKLLAEQVAKLEKQIQRGAKNLMLAEPEDVPEAKRVLAEWRQQRGALEAELKALGASGKASGGSADELVNRALRELTRLQEHLKASTSPEGKEAFKRLFDKVTVTWHDRPAGQRNFRVAKVVIEAPSKLALFLDNAHCYQQKRQLETTVFEYQDREIPPILIATVEAVRAETNGRPARLPGIARRMELGKNTVRQRLYRCKSLGLITQAHRAAWTVNGEPVAATIAHKRRKARRVKPR